MSSQRRTKSELIDDLRMHTAREQAHWTVAFSQAAAERLGLNATDLRSLSIVADAGRLTAGQLAERAGLTTGAITGILDRLERAGFVRREHDSADRRRVYVELIPQRMGAVGDVFGSSQQAWVDELNRYTVEELEFIHDFLARSTQILQEETRKLRANRKDSELSSVEATSVAPNIRKSTKRGSAPPRP